VKTPLDGTAGKNPYFQKGVAVAGLFMQNKANVRREANIPRPASIGMDG
jgi:hypothetical protein